MAYIEVQNLETETFFINSDKIAAILSVRGGGCNIYIGSDNPIYTTTNYSTLKSRLIQIEEMEKPKR